MGRDNSAQTLTRHGTREKREKRKITEVALG
jgi:hypothetical protein